MTLTLLTDLIPRIKEGGDTEAIRYDNGFRRWTLSYADLYARIAGACRFLDERNVGRGDRLLLWSSNSPQWVTLFWACVARGVQVVPVDPHSSADLIQRIQSDVGASLMMFEPGQRPPPLTIACLALRDFAALNDEITPVQLHPDDIVQIVYTSGTTATPRGVSHRHRNICANLRPIAEGIEEYRHYARPFQPIRILTLLPLSHMFGQAVGIFVPILLGGAAVFTAELSPSGVVRCVKQTRSSVVAAVPRMLYGLRAELERRLPLADVQPVGKGWLGALRRWWRYRPVHRLFGWKFWAFVVGGASVEPELERFWKALGFAVIQGYGLTESSPVVALNHPFDSRQGSIGKAVPGQSIRIADDGEILVKGESVTDVSGRDPSSGAWLDSDGWLHTGDVGAIDQEGRIYFKGRKKEMIVNSSGLNIFPEEVEKIVKQLPGVAECVVVGRPTASGEEVHAVVLGSGVDSRAIMREANRQLETHQQLRGVTIWKESDFPRTASTLKIRRAEIVDRLWGNEERRNEDPVGELIAEFSGSSSAAHLDRDLGLTSLDRVELLSRLEDRFATNLDEERFARIQTVQQLRAEVSRASTHPATPARRSDLRMPVWPDRWAVRLLRRAALDLLLLPGLRRLVRLKVTGLEALSGESGPLLIAANHASHLDAPAIMAALPGSWRHRVTPAMLKQYFAAHFEPTGHPRLLRWKTSLKYYLACGLFHCYPLPQRVAGVRQSLRFTGNRVEKGFCPLIFPEGIRTSDGSLLPFQDGIGLMAMRLRTPVLPVFIQGAFEAYSQFDEWPGAGYVVVHFGSLLHLQDEADPRAATRSVEQAIHALARQAAAAADE